MDTLKGLERLLIFVKNKQVPFTEAATIINNTLNDLKPNLNHYSVNNPQCKCHWCGQEVYEIVVKDFMESFMCGTQSCEMYR